MPNAITPLIKRLGSTGTLITFQSANDDISYAFNNNTKGMNFSKFVLLDIPDILTPSSGENTIQFNAIEGAFSSGLSVATPFPSNERFNLAESLQNYMLNMEAMLIRDDNYDATLDLTVAERVFWKWLKELGAIRYRVSDPLTESSPSVSYYDGRFVEEDDSSTYTRVVKYVGEIDMEGNNRSNTNAYKEVYMLIPTQCGGSPYVQFKCVSDNNYKEGMTIIQNGTLNITYIQGQDGTPSVTSAGLRVLAFYDQTAPDGTFNYTMNSVADEYWFKPMAANGPHAYFTDLAFNDAANDVHTRGVGSISPMTYIRSRLDGVCIDFDMANYLPMYSDSTISSFADWNARPTSTSNFEFNAIGIYYDVFDTSTPGIRTTNLWGILFINDLQIVGSSGAAVERFSKTKPDNTLGQTGNGYSLKLNLRFDAVGGNVDVEVSVNDYNTFSMLLFAESMVTIARMISQGEQIISDNAKLAGHIAQLENIILNSDNAKLFSQQIKDLQNQINTFTSTDSVSGISGLITKLNGKVDDIIKGKYTISLASVLNLIANDGLGANKVGDSYVLSDSKQAYGSTGSFNMYLGTDQSLRRNIFKLNPKTNLYYHSNGGVEVDAICDIQLFIDDTLLKWKTNQSVKIYLEDSIIFSTYGISIFTDGSNVHGNGTYGTLVGIIPTPSNHQIIEIICLDETNYKFLVIA